MSSCNILLTHCRNNMYLIIGICLGLSMSLLLAPVEINDCGGMSDPLPYSLSKKDVLDDYEPRINTKEKPEQARKTPKNFIRPRYYSTELGIREKLFVGVITSKEFLHSRGIAINKTIAHLVDKIRFFISIPEGTKPNVSFPGIVGFTDTRSILKPFHVIKYIIDNYLEDYDYYFLINDTGFINGRKLKSLVEKISVSQDIHLGMRIGDEDYCFLDAGIILSNSIIREMKVSLDWCVKNTFSDNDDINLGRCILHAISLPCSESSQGIHIKSTFLKPNFKFEKDFIELEKRKNFLDSISVFPIYDHQDIYKMNAYFASRELLEVQKEILQLRESILRTSSLQPENQRRISWPVGIQPINKAPGRFDLLHWIYFNETHIFSETDFETMRILKGSLKKEVEQVLKAAIEKVILDSGQKLSFKNLINGYKRFDASRGMDFILDMTFVSDSGDVILKRIEVCKPLGKLEILPVPYVTENSRINMILIVDPFNREESMKFLENYKLNCLEKREKIILLMVLLYNPDSLSKGEKDIYFELKKHALFLTEKYKKDQTKITWLSIRLPETFNLVGIEPLLKIAIADLSVKKFTPESLILFAEIGMEIRTEYLNRIRMNTINQWQVFSPVPFVEFHPDIIYSDNKNTEFDVVRNLGRYDDMNYDSVSFYARDYYEVRKIIEEEIPMVRSDKDISTILNTETSIGSIFEMFVTFSRLHSFRAVEPALRIRHRELFCNATHSPTVFHRCIKRRNLHLGNRGELSRLIFKSQSEF